MNNNTRITIRISKEQLDKIKRTAEVKNKTASQVIREAVHRQIGDNTISETPESPIGRAVRQH